MIRRAGPRSPFGSRILGTPDQSPRALRVRVQLLLTGLLVSSNVVGAALVVVISLFVVPAPAPNERTVLALVIAVPVYVGAAVVVAATVGTGLTVRAVRWAMAGEEPDARDREVALRVPLRLTQLQALMWAAACVLFTLLSVGLQPSRAVTTGLTVGIAGVVGSGVAYLLTEWVWRPVAARALAGQPFRKGYRGAGVAGRMVVLWCLGTAAPVVGLAVTAILALTGEPTTLERLAVVALVISGVVLTIGLFITVLTARSVVAPVLSVRDALVEVERGDLDREVVVYDATELGLLQSGFNEMVSGLREREHLRDLFGRHVGREVARAASLGEVELGGEARRASVLFVDLKGSTTYADEHTPTEVVELLNRFFGVVVDEVDRRQGLVNKFIGDAVLAVFGAPVTQPDHVDAALAAARAMADRLREEVPEVEAGIGVATGELVAGNVGHRERFEYTVIGDVVNCAARLSDLAKETPARVLAVAEAVEAAGREEARCWTEHGSTTLRGRSQATRLAAPVDATAPG